MSINDMLAELSEKTLDLSKLPPSKQMARLREISGDPRMQNVDIIWTQTGINCCTAVVSGWYYGFQSVKRPCRGSTGTKLTHDVVFVDCEFKDYKHEKHKRWVKETRPKYATVRDVMTPQQCEEAGIKYYSPEQIKKWADDLKQYADNILIVPKYKEAMKLFPPDQYMVGYSVPTSYGGCYVPIREFKDYKIHLLGGSPSAQISYFGESPDNVVSLDNNYIHKMACKGQIWLLNGKVISLNDLNTLDNMRKGIPPEEIGFGHTSNILYIACAISQGNFATFWRHKHIEDMEIMSPEYLKGLDREH